MSIGRRSNVRQSKNPKPSWYGESVDHYENGDTLVIDSIGEDDKTFVDDYRTPHSGKIHIVERWKLARDAKTVDVSIYVEDRRRSRPLGGPCSVAAGRGGTQSCRCLATRITAITSVTIWCRWPRRTSPISDPLRTAQV
jgi:hypothetical protein